MASPVIEIVPAIDAHVRELSKCLREEDAAEITCFDKEPHKMLWRGFKNSILKRTAIVDGKVAAMWGVGGVPMTETGTPWLMTSYACERISPLRFVRIYQEEVKRMLQAFPCLVNFVSANYTKSVRLLENVGFVLEEPVPLGPHNTLFRKFTMKRAA